MFKHTRPYILLGLGLAALAAFYVWLQIPTYSGAIDAYAKQVILSPRDFGIIGNPEFPYDYTVYNWQRQNRRTYTGTLAISFYNVAANQIQMHAQPVTIQKSGLFWQVQAEEDFQKYTIEATEEWNIFPARAYAADWGDFRLQLSRQTSAKPYDNVVPTDKEPHARFMYSEYTSLDAYYTGNEENKAKYTSIGVSAAAMNSGQERPQMLVPVTNNQSFTTGGGQESVCAASNLNGDWPAHIGLGGGGMSSSDMRDIEVIYPLPKAYAVDLYLNGELAAELTLLPVEN